MSRNETIRAGLPKLNFAQGLEYMTTELPFSSSSYQLFERHCKFAILRKNDAFVAKIAKKRKIMAIFAFAESLTTSTNLSYHDIYEILLFMDLFTTYRWGWLTPLQSRGQKKVAP